MPTYPQAEKLAAAWVDICTNGRAALMLEHTITRPYGWVFFYQSHAYIQTKNFKDMLLGTAAILIDRVNGEVLVTGTAHPIETYLKQYEAKIPPARLKMTPQPPTANPP